MGWGGGEKGKARSEYTRGQSLLLTSGVVGVFLPMNTVKH